MRGIWSYPVTNLSLKLDRRHGLSFIGGRPRLAKYAKYIIAPVHVVVPFLWEVVFTERDATVCQLSI